MKQKRLSMQCCVLALVLVPLFPMWSRAASQDELMEKIRLLEVQIQELKELKQQQRLSAEKERMCVTAVGNEKICSCIAAALPADVGFERYVHIVVSTAEELRNDTLNPDERKNIDVVRAVREKCVKKGFFK
jgi:type II secretory pathway pseudopilin PulG